MRRLAFATRDCGENYNQRGNDHGSNYYSVTSAKPSRVAARSWPLAGTHESGIGRRSLTQGLESQHQRTLGFGRQRDLDGVSLLQ